MKIAIELFSRQRKRNDNTKRTADGSDGVKLGQKIFNWFSLHCNYRWIYIASNTSAQLQEKKCAEAWIKTMTIQWKARRKSLDNLLIIQAICSKLSKLTAQILCAKAKTMMRLRCLILLLALVPFLSIFLFHFFAPSNILLVLSFNFFSFSAFFVVSFSICSARFVKLASASLFLSLFSSQRVKSRFVVDLLLRMATIPPSNHCRFGDVIDCVFLVLFFSICQSLKT